MVTRHAVASLLGLSVLGGGSFPVAAQSPPKMSIESVSANPLKQQNACTRVEGGTGIFTAITVEHQRLAGAAISLQLYDRFKTGGGYDHQTTTKLSSATGTTIFTAAELSSAGLIPPCHTGRNPERVSNYFWIASSGNSKKEFLWGQMTMAAVR